MSHVQIDAALHTLLPSPHERNEHNRLNEMSELLFKTFRRHCKVLMDELKDHQELKFSGIDDPLHTKKSCLHRIKFES